VLQESVKGGGYRAASYARSTIGTAFVGRKKIVITLGGPKKDLACEEKAKRKTCSIILSDAGIEPAIS
jgi:hypothetical protein